MKKKKYPRAEKYPVEVKDYRSRKLTITGVLPSSLIEFDISFSSPASLSRLINFYKKNYLLFYGDFFPILFQGYKKRLEKNPQEKQISFKKSMEIIGALLDKDLDLENLPEPVRAILPEDFSSWPSNRDKKEVAIVQIISSVFADPIKTFKLKIHPYPFTRNSDHNFYTSYVEMGKKALNDEGIKSLLPLSLFPYLKNTLIEIKKSEPSKKDLAKILLKIIPA